MKKIALLLGVFFLLLAGFLAWFVPSAFFGTPGSSVVSINLPEGIDSKQTAEILEQKGVIASAWGYEIYALIDQQADKPKPGDYMVAPGASYRDLARVFILGPKRDEIAIRILEGQTLDDVAKELSTYGVAMEEYSDLVGSRTLEKSFAPALREQFEFLSDLPPDATLEGYLFPDTYRVWKDQLPLGFVLKQLQAFAKNTEGFVEEADAQDRGLHEIVIMASLIEKEGRTPEERRMIAGIIQNRLKAGMRLQLDSTINYLTGSGRARSSLQDLEIVSPYNTYKNAGLPPGPICNPGKDSLEAALNPKASNYYFYLHDDQGKIYYARNLEEHKINRYQAYGAE
ncbi:MAG TPA: endolytic transglycosylase MltG [bacterium]|nr:MAG: putative aminodeoxychorismate lyase [Parcubacteria group bacterium ADurb.Bin192]HPN14569.1 endolytic transglycosylase MltG [bacterium]